MHAYVTSDFSVANVAENSHSTKPLLYRISGVWGNHEGSMLLWVLILALFGAAVAIFGGNLPATLRANVLAVQASIAVAFCLFIVLTSNPFVRLDPPPFDGRGLNPILQDPALSFHPPFLYMGYVGFSMAFSFAIAALIEGRTDAAWARWVRPWTLAAWMCLTIGIAMGSWWAYYELGWGGWWFWDPVENASFMPWLAGTALLHSALVMEKREALRVWTILLAILTFSLSLMGTFLVRSGVLSSVHAFAVDPGRGVFVLAILTLFTGGGLALFAYRARDLAQGGIFAPISREGSARAQQHPAHDGVRDGADRHALSARARGTDGREDLGRRALLQHDVRLADAAASAGAAVRPAARLEARRRARREPAAGVCGAGRDRGDCRRVRRCASRPVAGAVRHRARRVGDGGCGFGGPLAVQARPGAAAAMSGGGSRACRARPTARCSRISASG